MNKKEGILKKNWVRVIGAFLLLAGLVLGLAPAAALAQAQVLDHVVVSPSSATVAAGATQQFSAQGYDVSNVAIPGLTYFWAAAAASGAIHATSGVFTAGNVPGVYPNAVQAIVVQNGNIKFGNASVTVTAVAPTLDHVTIAPASATLAPQATQQFSAQGYDASNVALPNLTYYWSVVVAGAGIITPAGLFTAGTIPGVYPNAVQGIAVQGNAIVKYATASVTVTGVTAGALDHVTVTPSSATLAPGGTQQFSAQGYDASNVPIPNLAYYWSVAVAGAGTITPAGVFKAGSIPGSYPNAVQGIAVQGNAIIKFATASVTVSGATAGALDHVRVTPSSANVAVGATRQFSAQGYDAANKPIPGLTYYWSVVVAGAGTITQAGLFQAGNVPNSYPNAVQAIALQNGTVKYATASVTVTAAPQADALTSGTKRLHLLVAASLRGIAFENFLGAQWTVKENGATSIIKAIPGVVKAISNTSLTLLPNGQTQTVSFALTADTLVLAKDGLKVDEKAVVVTVNDQTRLVLEVPIPSVVQSAPPGIRKQLDKLFDKFEDRFTPPGWDKGKKTGWDRDDDDEDDDDDDD
ncbi:MAG: hypothetical protein KJ624_06230 [Chloroflexi bacterium]|nr:hypothetical protein [Chloroflexota bacterium]